MTRRRVLITGGAGFLGSHLCDRYVAEGWDVICVDNERSGLRENVAHLSGHPAFTYVKHDVCESLTCEGPLDLVLHMASLASPPFYKKYPIDTLMVGSVGTKHAAELAIEKKARFVFASTSEVYGDPLESPQRESYWGHVNPVGPRSMYDESKRFGEALVTALRGQGASLGIVRIFNTYGPRMRPDDGRVVTQFLVQLIKGEPMTIHGDGAQTRSFCYVGDLVDGIVRMGASTHPGPINLGNPYDEMRITVLAERLSLLFGKPMRQSPPMPPQDADDPRHRRPDITLAREALHWEPRTSFEDGMRATYAWLEQKS